MGTDIVQLGVQALTSGMKILVVGASPGNLGKWHHLEDRRLLVWPSTGRDFTRRSLPGTIGLVVLTKFHGHRVTERLRSQLPRTSVICQKLLGTGELKKVLEDIFSQVPMSLHVAPQELPILRQVMGDNGSLPKPVTPVTVVDTVIAEEPKPVLSEEDSKENQNMHRVTVKRGALKEFLIRNANVEAVPATEARRLLKLATDEGLMTTFASLAQALRNLKNTKTSTTAEPSAPSSPPPPRRKLRSDSTELLSVFCKQSELVAVAVVEILEENKRLREQVRTLEATLKNSRKSIREALSGLR